MTKGETMLAYARAQIGKPYVFGASGPNSFDCSGLTKRAAALIGLNWYHGATTQWVRGLATGDATRYGYWESSGEIGTLPPNRIALLFNRDKAKSSLVMAHTGMYDGNGRVVQAGGYGGKGVHEGTIDKRRWSHWAIVREDDTTTPQATTTTRATLKRGSTGDDVLALQTLLNTNGATLVPDGKFGAMTESAVIAYQGAHELTPDGIVGRLTWAKLYQTT